MFCVNASESFSFQHQASSRLVDLFWEEPQGYFEAKGSSMVQWFGRETKRRSIRVSRMLRLESFNDVCPVIGDIHDETWEMFSKINQALLQIDFDMVACTQRSVCWHVKNSLLNIQENRSRKVDKFIEGFVK